MDDSSIYRFGLIIMVIYFLDLSGVLKENVNWIIFNE